MINFDLKIRPSSFEAQLSPTIYQLDERLYLAQFSVMKLVPAYGIIKAALERGEINEQTLIIDTSSGTFALGLALVCHHFKLPLTIVCDPAIDQVLRCRLEDLGTKVITVTEPDAKGNYQNKRLEVIYRILDEHENVFWCRQYDNPDNQRAYHGLAQALLDLFPRELHLVASVGSGGSSSGLMSHIRRSERQDVSITAVDTFGSVLFGLPDRKRPLRGLGNSLLPKNLEQPYYDHVQWLDAATAYAATRQLHQRHGIYAGATSGASYWVGRYVVQTLSPKADVVVIGPDDGHRYATTVYDDTWLLSHGLYGQDLPARPYTVRNLAEVPSDQPWVHLPWQRRRLQDWAGEAFTAALRR